jgi:DNA-binding winged helix-turn-helix (wHTH) protein/TolB-like protein/Flp pilus assembly protein TadD
MSVVYEFGEFLLNPQERLLLCDGKPVSLTPKAFELFLVLVQREGHLVEKEELLRIVWPDVAVEEGNLAVMVSHLRKVLGDDRGTHTFIETVPRHGYRFVAQVARRMVPDPSAASVAVAELLPSKAADDPAAALAPAALPPAAIPATRVPPSLLLALVVFALCTGILAWRTIRQNRAKAASTDVIHSLAVLPFQEIGAQGADNYLGEGMADALITRLGRFSSLIVRPTSAIERYRSANLNPVQIGRQQSVDAVLEGLMQREGDRMRLTVQLVRVHDGATLWADSFDEKFTDLFGLEDEISQRVAQSLQIHLSRTDVKGMARRPTENTAAYDAYLKGRYFWNKRTTDAVERGLGYFRQAITLDPHFAEGYEGIADSYATMGLYGSMPPDQAFPAARKAALKALSMDDSLADAHATLGLISFYYDWDGAAAEDEFRRAIEINPNYAMAHSWSGETLAAMGRFPEAIQEAKRALNDDPLSLIVNSNAGWTFFLAGQSDQAIQILQKAIEFDPNFPRTHFRLGIIYEASGRRQDAIKEFQKAVQFSNQNPYYEASLAEAYGQSGDVPDANRVLALLKSRAQSEYVPAFGFALVYEGLHDKDAAFQWLQKASLDHSTSMAFAKLDPSLASLRTDQRFATVAQNLRF